MLKNILTYKEYKEIIDHCKNCKSSYAIKDFIDDIFGEFGKSNTNLVLSLMEYIEINNRSLQGISDLIENDHLDIYEELKFLKTPTLEYLYSYLIYILDNKGYGNQKRENIEEVNFQSKIPIKKTAHILSRLKEKQFCNFSDVSKIIWVFSQVDKKNAKKIQWIDKSGKAKQPNYQTLFFMLDNICGAHIISTARHNLIISINKSFYNSEGKSFEMDNMFQVLKRYRNKKRENRNLEKREMLLKDLIEG
jgi:hypothetical protein